MMMKKIFRILIFAFCVGCFPMTYQSCNYLDIDQYITDMQSLDSVFRKKETTEQFLYNAYSYLVNTGKAWDDDANGIPWVPCSDECFGTLYGAYNAFGNNIMDAGNDYYVKWKKYYEGIRNTGIFLNRVTECEELSSIQLKEYIGEAQFLKAYYYFELMKQYGPVCIVPEEGFRLDQSMDEILIARSTWPECVAYVADLLKQAAMNLPIKRPGNEFGKPTQGAAYAVLSRLLLYDASPLFNGNTSYADFVNKRTGVPYISQEYEEVKWALAAAAARKVIRNEEYELYAKEADKTTPALPANVTSDPHYYDNYPEGANGIDAYRSYSEIFNGTVPGSTNKEIIFGFPSMSIDKEMAPLKMRGWSCYNIPQKLVDAYYMANGKTITEGSTDPDYPYATEKSSSEKSFSGYILPAGTYGWYLNREMRFYATVGFNNSYYLGSSSTNAYYKNFKAGFFNGGNCDKSNNFTSDPNTYCMTGYLCRKFQHPEDVYTSSYGAVKAKVWMEYRLGEIYLNYVEALNELNGGGSYTVDGEVIAWNAADVKKYFNMIRYRAGLPGVTDSDVANKERMRELIRKERQIELAWEGLRYFDVRRWKIADTEENMVITGMAVNKKENEGFYSEVQVREVSYAYKTYSRRKNFWPIPQTEITKNTQLDQNPGW